VSGFGTWLHCRLADRLGEGTATRAQGYLLGCSRVEETRSVPRERARGTPKLIGYIDAIGDQSAGDCKKGDGIDRRQLPARDQCNDLTMMHDREIVRQHDNAGADPVGKAIDGRSMSAGPCTSAAVSSNRSAPTAVSMARKCPVERPSFA
jgi:hypothetical protein